MQFIDIIFEQARSTSTLYLDPSLILTIADM